MPPAPAVPQCNLPRLHAALRQHGLLEGAEVCTLRDTLSRIFAPRPRPAAA